MASTAKRQGNGSTTREQIVRRAIELFASNGYAYTSLDDIARAVGIRKPSLYHYINGKEDLLYEIDALLVGELLEEARRLVAEASTHHEKLRAFFRAGMRLIARRQQEVTIFLGERHALDSSSPRWREIAKQRDEYEQMFGAVIVDGMDAGAFRRLPTTLAAVGMLGAISWAFRWYNPRGELGPDEIADLFADIVLNGIAAEPG
jgi:AcrR family transcriptional regulator